MRKDFSHIKIHTLEVDKSFYPHEKHIAGMAPYTRGIHTCMYLQHPVKISNEINKNYHIIRFEKVKTVDDAICYYFNEATRYVQELLKENKTTELIFELPICTTNTDTIIFAKVARTLWANIISKYYSKNEYLAPLKMSYKMREDTLEQLTTAVFSGVQILLLPSNSQLSIDEWQYLLDELQITKVIDPWAGNPHIEERINYFLKKYRDESFYLKK